MLPSFDLRTVKAPFPDALCPSPYKDWETALDDLKAQVSRDAFDVAIIGAGAFSLPLISYAKSLGSQGIHLGGGTQILFGILGKRWDDDEEICQYANPSWIRPAPDERPLRFQHVEDGCYW